MSSLLLKISVLFFICFGLAGIALGQDFNYKRYTTEDGLPSNDIYDVVEDTNGFLWFATEYGVCRFDGYEFTTFSIDDGLTDLFIRRLFLDQFGSIWISDVKGGIAWFENDSFYSHPLNSKIREKAQQQYIDHLYVDDEKSLWLSPFAGGIFKVNASGNISALDTSYLKDYKVYFEEKEGGYVFDKPYLSKTKKDSTYRLEVNLGRYYIDFHSRRTHNSNVEFLKLSNGILLASINNSLFRIEGSRIELAKTYSGNILQIHEDEDYLMVSVGGRGVFRYKASDLDGDYDVIFENKQVSNVYKDFEGNYWFTVFHEGVYLIPSFNVKVFNKSLQISNSSIVDFDITEQQILFSTYDKKVYLGEVKDGNVESSKEFEYDGKGCCLITGLLLQRNGAVWLFGTPGFKYNQEGQTLPLEYNMNTGISLYEDGYGMVCHGDKSSFNIYSGAKCIVVSGCQKNMNISGREIDFENKCFNHKVNCFFRDEDSVLWLGTDEGLYSYTNGFYRFHGDEVPGFSRRISGLEAFHDFLVVIVHDYGIFFRGKEGHITPINFKDGIAASAINDFVVFDSSTLWLATNNGLSQMKFFKIDPLIYTVYNYSKWDGVLSNNIKKIAKENHYLWMSSESGLASINTRTFASSKRPPRIIIKEVRGNSKVYHLNTLKLKHDENNIRIKYQGISYKNPGNLSYKYMLEGYHEDWEYSKNTEVNFASLSPGKYRFKVSVQNIQGIWNKNPAEVYIIIESPVWKRWWFILLSVVLFVGVMVIMYNARIRAIKRKNKLEQDLINYHQQSLSKQMNPHFIYNSLNSIHRYVLENDSLASSKYLTKFSKLMRLTLDISQKQMVRIDEEVKALNLYLELESMRFKQFFDYKVTISPELKSKEFRIPAFFIQPFVENAIWHGLMDKEGEKKLSIDFSKQRNFIICRVVDNGIGRKAAMQKEQFLEEEKKSYGIQIIRERMQLFNKTYKPESMLEIEDLFENGKPAGTCVRLSFPILD